MTPNCFIFTTHTWVLALLISTSTKHHNACLKSFPLHFCPSFSRAKPPTETFPLVIGRTTIGFYFRWLNSLKILRHKLTFPWQKNARNINESRQFLHRNKHNAKQNFQTSSPRTALKLSRQEGHGVTAEALKDRNPFTQATYFRLQNFSSSKYFII